MVAPRGAALEFPKILALAALQGLGFGLAKLAYDLGHPAPALLLALAAPVGVGFAASRYLSLSLQATFLSYAVLPLLGAAVLRGIPAIVLRASIFGVALALGPTGLGWWLGSRARPVRRATPAARL